MVAWNLPNGRFLKNATGSEEDQLLAGAFHVSKDKIEVDILQRYEIENESSYIKDTFSERFQL